jgi:hypothetical protein
MKLKGYPAMLNVPSSTPHFSKEMRPCKFLVPGVICLLFVAGEQVGNAVDTAVSWGDVRVLEFTWRQLASATKPGREAPNEADLFAYVISKNVPYDYQYALMLELTDRNSKLALSRDFMGTAPAGFATLFANRGDRASLVTVLSRRCPEKFLKLPVEVWLAPQQFDEVSLRQDNLPRRPYGKIVGLPNGILVLCDAFDQSTDKEVRLVISKALRNAFDPHLTAPADDSRTANVCREWFSRHHTEFYVNVENWHPGSSGLNPSLQLFRRRASTEK